ncbi:hypothetical protein FQA39_LY08741 [Lamprigera yunnana]|nr:hypothetical protein FQA39_LY08741 [Lamprigera yunnana]
MKTNKVTYHNVFRALFCSGILQRQLKKREIDSANVRAAVIPNTKLKTQTRAATKSSRGTFHQQTYDPLIIAQLLALVKCNNSPQKVSQMKKWFKEHLLKKLGSDWYSFNDGKEVYISHKKTIGANLADTSRTQVTEDEADKTVDVAVLLRKYIVFQQMPFNGSFSSGCLTDLWQLNEPIQSNHHSVSTKGQKNTLSSLLGTVMEVRKQFAQTVCKRWQEDEVIVPTNIKRKVFATIAVDNVDETGGYEFHGTAMSLISHSTYDNIGEDPPPLTLGVSESCTVELPDSYSIAPFVDEYAGNVSISGINNASTFSCIEKNDELLMAERHWLQHLNMVKSATMAMQKHCMHIAMKATEFVNPGQIPVLMGDCPLYAL